MSASGHDGVSASGDGAAREGRAGAAGHGRSAAAERGEGRAATDPSAEGMPDPGAPAAEERRARLERECGILRWAELVRHFARGVVVRVDDRVELVDAALCMAEDDTRRLQAWLEEGSVARASDDDARDWTAREPEFRCVVVAPWVLVREVGL